MAKTLKEVLNNNTLIMQYYGTLWEKNFSFHSPFDEQASLPYGSEEWENSLYCKEGLGNQINPCSLSRKAFFRLFYIFKGLPLGRIYKVNDDVVCEYNDETLEEINSFIDGGSLTAPRHIIMKINGGVVSAGCVTQSGSNSQLKFGSNRSRNEHSLASYIYGFTSWILASDEDKLSEDEKSFKADFNEMLNSFKVSGQINNDRLTRLENDIVILLNRHDAQKGVVKPDYKLMEDAKKNGKVFIDPMAKASLSSKKPTFLSKPRKLSEIVAKKTYDLGHELVGDEKELVPTSYDDIVVDENIADTLMIIKARHDKGLPCNVMYTGEAGTGKTTAAQMLARALGLPYYFLTCCTNTESYDLQYRNAVEDNQVKLVESQVLKAFRDGGIIELQEFNMVRKQSVLTFLNSALDGIGKMETQTGTIVNRNKDCIFVFSMNVGYEGTAPINQALRSRMNVKINFELPDNTLLSEELVKVSSLPNEITDQMVKCFEDIRTALAEGGEDNGICSRRELTDWAVTSKIFMDYGVEENSAIIKAAKETIIPSATDDEDLKSELLEIVGHYWSVL